MYKQAIIDKEQPDSELVGRLEFVKNKVFHHYYQNTPDDRSVFNKSFFFFCVCVFDEEAFMCANGNDHLNLTFFQFPRLLVERMLNIHLLNFFPFHRLLVERMLNIHLVPYQKPVNERMAILLNLYSTLDEHAVR
jgi:hypothetical protein